MFRREDRFKRKEERKKGRKKYTEAAANGEIFS